MKVGAGAGWSWVSPPFHLLAIPGMMTLASQGYCEDKDAQKASNWSDVASDLG